MSTNHDARSVSIAHLHSIIEQAGRSITEAGQKIDETREILKKFPKANQGASEGIRKGDPDDLDHLSGETTP